MVLRRIIGWSLVLADQVIFIHCEFDRVDEGDLHFIFEGEPEEEHTNFPRE
jgi:hypothetical protein